MLTLPKQIFDKLIIHAEEIAPIESCGMLLGRDEMILRHYRMTNKDNSTDHFTLEPREQFAVIKLARQNGLKIFAVYHSHPATPARPSEEDIKLAFDPNISYVILSLSSNSPDIKSLRIRNGSVEKEELKIVLDAVEDEYDEFEIIKNYGEKR